MLIEKAIFSIAHKFPDKTAIVEGEKSFTYHSLCRQITKAALWYKNHGFKNGQRVVLAADKSADFVIWYFGTHLAGLICVPIDTETNPGRLERIISIAHPSLLLGRIKSLSPDKQTDFPTLPESCPGETYTEEPTFDNAEYIADIIFTTGTTGMPKGVALSHDNLYAAVSSINSFIGNDSNDVELMALPISHSFGLGRLRCVLAKGGTLIMLHSGFAATKRFFKALHDYNITGFGMVPSSWAYLKKMSGDKLGEFADRLKYIEMGSAYLPAAEKEKLSNLLPATRICMHYGLTEASRSTFLCFNESKEKLNSVGRPSPGVDVKIIGEDGTEAAVGVDGEICIQGEHVCSGYWDESKDLLDKNFFGRYFRSGDWGHLDEDGYIYIVSRKKEIINVGGKKVSPLEVEEVINTIDGVSESACVGVKDEVLGEVVKAFIVSKEELDYDSVTAILRKKLESYKIPAYYERIDKLPKTSSGKLQRLSLVKESH